MLSLLTKLTTGIQSKVIIVLVVIILSMCTGIYWYFRYSQNEFAILNQNIATLEANEATLKTEITKQNDSIRLLDKERGRDQQTVVDMALRFGETQAEIDVLKKKLEKHNLSNLTLAKPKLIEGIINNGTKKVFENLESISDPTTYIKEKQK